MIDFLLRFDTWLSLMTLTFLEIILNIDNIVFILIISNKLPEERRRKAINIGLALAMIQRLLLLAFVSYLLALKKTFYAIELSWFTMQVNGQAIILFLGGLFLLYKSTSEIYKNSENKAVHENSFDKNKNAKSFFKALLQILIIDLIFSIDSILTAIGMVNGISDSRIHSLIIMSTAVIISVLIMISFANVIRKYIEKHPSLKLLVLSFLILISFLLITEAAHASQTSFFGNPIEAIPKGYLYFAILFALLVELVKIKVNKNSKKR